MSVSIKILVIDDEEGMRDLLRHELGRRGYGVVTASDGEQALRALRKEDFQLVISDVKMPGLSGIETLAAIKRISPDVEVILATGYATVDDAVTAMRHGAYDFIQKPFSVDALLILVEKALEKRELKAVVALYEASKVLFQTIKLDTLLPIITKLTRAVLRADDVSILLVQGEKLEVAAALGLDSASRMHSRVALGERVAGRVAVSREPVIICGPLESDPAFAKIEGLRDIKTSLVYPLCVNSEILGVLCANRTMLDDPFHDADLRHMAIFGAQISQAVYNAKAFAQVQEAQNRLIQAERMSAVGRLAAGVAHELNNPLTSILGFAQMLLQEASFSAIQREDMQCIMEQGQRCKVIVQGLLQFGRKSEPNKEIMTVEALVASVLRLARLDIETKKIQLILSPIDPGMEISADLCQMQQVLLNMIVNASHAMEARTTKNLEIRAESASGRVLIHFKDSGCGIPAENMGRIFEPFFTTKPVGKGTGLGLSVCRDILIQHGGAVRVASEPGEGTMFTIELPLHRRVPSGPGRVAV